MSSCQRSVKTPTEIGGKHGLPGGADVATIVKTAGKVNRMRSKSGGLW
ncbi:MAG: hypothetical protein MI923_24730 [Phycisphaerales bacterium]|nr:hypothetical protein [Phycisphaerales bacterium]